jgi:aspartate 4-decarboxylase
VVPHLYLSEGVGSFPKRERIEQHSELFASKNKNIDGIVFLRGAVSYVHDQLDLNASDFLYEICEGLLGCSYPVPDRMLSLSEKIVGHYLHNEMIGTQIRSPHVLGCFLIRKIVCYFCYRSSHRTS